MLQPRGFTAHQSLTSRAHCVPFSEPNTHFAFSYLFVVALFSRDFPPPQSPDTSHKLLTIPHLKHTQTGYADSTRAPTFTYTCNNGVLTADKAFTCKQKCSTYQCPDGLQNSGGSALCDDKANCDSTCCIQPLPPQLISCEQYNTNNPAAPIRCASAVLFNPTASCTETTGQTDSCSQAICCRAPATCQEAQSAGMVTCGAGQQLVPTKTCTASAPCNAAKVCVACFPCSKSFSFCDSSPCLSEGFTVLLVFQHFAHFVYKGVPALACRLPQCV